MLDEIEQSSVPTAETDGQPVSEQHTENASQSPTPTDKALTASEVAKILDEKLSQLDQRFATRDDLLKTAQSASDKRFAKLMKDLAPEIKAIDTAVKHGRMDAEDAKQAKKDLFAEKAAELAGVDEETESAGFKQSPVDADRQIALGWLEKLGLTEEDVPEIAPGKPLPPFQEFVVLVTQRSTEKKTKTQLAQLLQDAQSKWQKEYEEKTKSVRTADQQGATKPPVAGGTPIRKRTLADADRIGEIYYNRKQ